jgi:hypothetical protein
VDAALAAGLPLEVLDDVRHVGARPIDAGCLQRLVEEPAGRADERLAELVLLVAGLFPTNMTSAFVEPSPNTVWVPVFQSGQALQPAAAARSFVRLGRAGTSGAALSPSRLCCAIATLGTPEARIPFAPPAPWPRG